MTNPVVILNTIGLPVAPQGYVSLDAQTFPNMRPFQVGQSTPIPSNTYGDTSHRTFSKNAQTVPWAKIVIRGQLLT